jgi:hypothetical protein
MCCAKRSPSHGAYPSSIIASSTKGRALLGSMMNLPWKYLTRKQALPRSFVLAISDAKIGFQTSHVGIDLSSHARVPRQSNYHANLESREQKQT